MKLCLLKVKYWFGYNYLKFNIYVIIKLLIIVMCKGMVSIYIILNINICISKYDKKIVVNVY